MGTGVQEGVQHSTWGYETTSMGCSKKGRRMGAKKGAREQGCTDTSYQATGSRWGGRRGGGRNPSVCVSRLKAAVLT